ncbi:MAG: hypothetical protein AAFV53_38700 [Myxococcota bacterium]
MKNLVVMMALLAGCDSVFDDWQPQERVDEGAACLVTNPDDPSASQFFDATTPITVLYDANICLSSSCDRNDDAAVDAAVEGGTIAISASASWEQNEGRNITCTDDCGFLGAEADLGVLAEGTYTVTFGGESLTLTIPGEQDACFGEVWF